MPDILEIYGVEYVGVTGIKATDNNGIIKTYIRPSGTRTLTENGSYDVTERAEVTVNVSGGQRIINQDKTISPTTAQQIITADSGYTGLGTVTVNAMPSGTEGTPTATKGAVANHAVTVTPSVTNAAGYITGGTRTGSGVTVTASELTSGNLAITENGQNINVRNYATVSVDVPTATGLNVQGYLGYATVASTSYTASSVAVTVKKTGTYRVSWVRWRTSNSGTYGTQLYVNGTSRGSAVTTFTGTYGQSVTQTGVTLNEGDSVVVRGRSRSTSYSIYIANLIIEQTS